MAAATVTREDVIRFRWHQHQLHRQPGEATGPTDVALLDYGVQDTGPDGATWALALRGASPIDLDDLAFAWTIRGAPHGYRRSDLGAVAVATAPWSERDAAKRIFDAAKPLKAAEIPTIDALKVVAGHQRDLTENPTVKGDLSSQLTALVDEPYLRFCRPCATIHLYEMPFRLAALQAGLALEPDTSPPVLHRVPGLKPAFYEHLAGEADRRFDVVRNHLRFYGPARAGDVATFVDAPLKEVKAHWPPDAVEVAVTDAPPGKANEPRYILVEHLGTLTSGGGGTTDGALRLLGSHDPFLQLRDRELLVTDEPRRKDLWRTLGRPGAIVAQGEIIGTWRPRAAGRKLTVRIQPWRSLRPQDRTQIEEQAERLAAHRGGSLAGLTEE